jgi:hypothetical protein
VAKHSAIYLLLLASAAVVEYSLLVRGQTLRPAPLVRGEWHVRLDAPCDAAPSRDVALTIDQSGADVELVWAGAPKLIGAIDRTVLRAKSSAAKSRASGSASCAPSSLRAELGSDAFHGALQTSDGRTIPFTATRSKEKRP